MLCKHKDLSLNFQHLCKNPGMAVGAHNLSIGWWRQGRSWEFASQPAVRSELRAPSSARGPASKQQGGKK